MSESITIHVKSSGEAKYDVEVPTSITVLELKQEIEKKSDIPFDRQRLIYSGKVMKDNETVAFYKIQSGHSIHLVKSAEKKSTSTSGNDGTQSTASSDGNSSNSGIPSNIAAGQGAFNPLGDLTGARYAGYTQLPSTSMFGPDGGMNSSFADPEQLSQMMSNPLFQQNMNHMLSDPQMLDFLIERSPQLRAMGPQARELLQSPFFRQMMSSPDTMRSMMEMSRNAGASPFGAMGDAFPAPGPNANTTGTESNTEGTNTTDTQATNAAANPFASLFPGGIPQDPSSLFGNFGMAPPAPAPVDNRPPEERYAEQLRQLNEMGFFDFDRNISALRRSGGNVQGAVEFLLSNF